MRCFGAGVQHRGGDSLENIDHYIAKVDELMKKFGGINAEASSAKQQSLEL